MQQINRPSLREKKSEQTDGVEEQRAELVMRAGGSYVSADIQERQAQGSTVRGQDEGMEQLSARAGSASPAPPAVRAWRNGQFTCRTLGQCSRTDGTSQLALYIQKGVCSRNV